MNVEKQMTTPRKYNRRKELVKIIQPYSNAKFTIFESQMIKRKDFKQIQVLELNTYLAQNPNIDQFDQEIILNTSQKQDQPPPTNHRKLPSPLKQLQIVKPKPKNPETAQQFIYCRTQRKMILNPNYH